MSDNSFEALKEITALHMMIVELNLYLNTHPYDEEALTARNAYIKKYVEMKDQYNRCFGMLNNEADESSYPWKWIEEPWPWECEANFII